MTRLGWWLLAGFAGAIALFALMLRHGGSETVTVARRQKPASAPGPTALAVPVAGVARSDLRDTWGETRAEGARAHHAIDIPAARGTAVIAAAAGRVEKLFDSRDGGRTVYVRVDPGTVHYYAHLEGYVPGLREGGAVARGAVLGTVGATGDADPGSPHLHFEVKRMTAGEGWWQGREVDPYPLLAGRAAGG